MNFFIFNKHDLNDIHKTLNFHPLIDQNQIYSNNKYK